MANDKPRIRNITTMAEASAALMAAFNSINNHYYNDEIDKPIITLGECQKKNAYGWTELNKNWTQGKSKRYEICLDNKMLGKKSVEFIIGVLMHEIVHLYNVQKGIKDNSRSGTYHNEKFKETAEAHGLKCTEVDKSGWAYTEPTEQTEQWIRDNINIKGFKIYKKPPTKAQKESKPKQSMRKYVCPSCGLIMRGTKEGLNVMCMDCKEQLIIES